MAAPSAMPASAAAPKPSANSRKLVRTWSWSSPRAQRSPADANTLERGTKNSRFVMTKRPMSSHRAKTTTIDPSARMRLWCRSKNPRRLALGGAAPTPSSTSTPRTPEARHALVAEVEDAFRDVHEVVHLERDVVEAGLRPSDERELMVDLVAAEEHHVVAVPVAFLEAEDVLVERVRAVDVGGPDDDVAEIERLHVAVAVVLAHLVVAPVELDDVPVRIAQAQVALRSGAVRRPRHLLDTDARVRQLGRGALEVV